MIAYASKSIASIVSCDVYCDLCIIIIYIAYISARPHELASGLAEPAALLWRVNQRPARIAHTLTHDDSTHVIPFYPHDSMCIRP